MSRNAPELPAHTFQAMGGVTEVQCGDTDAVARVATLFAEYEQTLSRFLDWSELTRLNRNAGTPFVASPLLYDAVSAAIAWARITGGAFDPTLLHALEAAGYDRTFGQIDRDAGARSAPARLAPGRWLDVTLNERAHTITLPEGVAIDLGGIGKGYTIDHAIALLGGHTALVNASGDLRVSGGGPDGTGWRIGVEDPRDAGRDIVVLKLRDGAVATSGTNRRAWQRGDTRYHHLIDPVTTAPSSTDLLSVTVVAATATAADVLAKAILLSGSARALRASARHGVESIGVASDGRIIVTPGLAAYGVAA